MNGWSLSYPLSRNTHTKNLCRCISLPFPACPSLFYAAYGILISREIALGHFQNMPLSAPQRYNPSKSESLLPRFFPSCIRIQSGNCFIDGHNAVCPAVLYILSASDCRLYFATTELPHCCHVLPPIPAWLPPRNHGTCALAVAQCIMDVSFQLQVIFFIRISSAFVRFSNACCGSFSPPMPLRQSSYWYCAFRCPSSAASRKLARLHQICLFLISSAF